MLGSRGARVALGGLVPRLTFHKRGHAVAKQESVDNFERFEVKGWSLARQKTTESTAISITI